MINAHKFSAVANELYSKRRQAIRHFEKSPDEFDLYGYGWDRGPSVLGREEIKKSVKRGNPRQLVRDLIDRRRPFPSYRGSVEDKLATMGSYRFSLCFENEKEVPNYITEKIFDSFAAGTVPVYLGAPNITDYVPPEAIVDLRQFRNLATLERYMRDMDQTEWTRMHLAGQEYLRSEAYLTWRPEVVFREIAELLGG
jgi:hypothetical protein